MADHLLDLDWENSYSESSHWGIIWQATYWEEAEWPEEYQLIKNKSYWGLNFYIPEDLLDPIIFEWAYRSGQTQ